MPPAARVRPYKDFLTPALHRQFSRAAVTLLGLCYAEALLVGEWNSLIWSWFPFGSAGIRTGLLFICAFSIFVLRVGQLHVGIRTTKSGLQTFQEYAFKYQTIQTAGWYIFSAWLFTETYLFSAPKDANIGWITAAHNGERCRLNERPIYLMSYFISLAILQTIIHLWNDYDRIEIPTVKTNSASGCNDHVSPMLSPSAKLRAQLPMLVTSSLYRAFSMTVAMPFIYSLFIRQTVWSYTLMFARMIWNLPRSSALPAIRPFHMNVLLRSLTAGVLLVLMWEIGNAVFSAYVAQEPLKNERPITYESRDPNGSLLTGLRGKKLQTRAFAFWELVYIAERFQGRRKAVFEEIDREGGSTWSQIRDVSLQMIKDINTRHEKHFNPEPEPKEEIVPIDGKKEEDGLPRIVKPAKTDDIYTAPAPPQSPGALIAQKVSNAAKQRNYSPSGSVLGQGEKLLLKARSTLLDPEQQRRLTPAGITATFEDYIKQFLRTSLGWPFRQEFRRRMAVVVLGRPYGDVAIIVDAIDALTRLCVCSLKEDVYGHVQNDVSTIITTFTKTATVLEEGKKKLGVHWTDVEAKQESPETDMILTALKKGLKELLNAFAEYAQDLGMSQKDVRLAKEMAATLEGKKEGEAEKLIAGSEAGKSGVTEAARASKSNTREDKERISSSRGRTEMTEVRTPSRLREQI